MSLRGQSTLQRTAGEDGIERRRDAGGRATPVGAALLAAGGVALVLLVAAAPVRGEEVSQAAGADLSSIGIGPVASAPMTAPPSAAVEWLAEAPQRRAPDAVAIAVARAAPLGPMTEIRLRGRISDGIDAALRLAEVGDEARGAFVRLFQSRLDLARDVGPDDHFDLVLATRGGAATAEAGALLYAAIDRAGASDVRLMKWRSGGGTTWLDTAAASVSPQVMRWPVSGRISSGFGLRTHPILHFARMHKGIDFAAGWGAPISAASDGIVIGAGWAGGYGRQVRIAHAGGLTTTYSHLGRLAVSPGMRVRGGQMIGTVGSSGLSTGPHLHYEVYRGGQAVNPLSARFLSVSPLDRADQERFRAQLAHYMRLAAARPQSG